MAKARDSAEADTFEHESPEWRLYLQNVHSKDELGRQPQEDYSQQLAPLMESGEDVTRLLRDEAEDASGHDQLLYDFGYSLGRAGIENGVDPRDIRADTLAVLAFLEIEKDSNRIPNPQYALKGLTDAMADSEGYRDAF